MNIQDLITKALQDGASDIHLVKGLAPRYRLDGAIKEMGSARIMPVSWPAVKKLLPGRRPWVRPILR